MHDMTVDIYADTAFGRAAINKLGAVPDNFRLYEAGWLGNHPRDWTVMAVTGAEFRKAKTGKNAGKLTVLIKGTERTVYVTKDEIAACR